MSATSSTPAPVPPYEGVQLPERFRQTPYDELPPGLKIKVDRATLLNGEQDARQER